MFSEQVVEGAAGVVIGGYMANAEKFRDKTVALVSCGAKLNKIRALCNGFILQ